MPQPVVDPVCAMMGRHDPARATHAVYVCVVPEVDRCDPFPAHAAQGADQMRG